MDSKEREAAKDIMAEMLRPTVEAMVKMAVDHVVSEAYKQDKGRHKPFYTRQWRGKR